MASPRSFSKRGLAEATNKVDYPLLTMSQTARQDWVRRLNTNTSSGTKVTEDTILEIDSVLSCVRVLAESMATLPFNIFETKGSGQKTTVTLAVDHPVYELLRFQPNPETTAYEMRMWMMIDCLLRGRGVAQVQRDGTGKPIALWQLEAKRLSPRRAPDDDRLIYVYSTNSNGKNKKNRKGEVLLEANEVLMIQMMPYAGLLGYSLVELQREAFGSSRAVSDFAAEFFANGGSVTGVIEVPETLDDPSYLRLKKDWKEMHSARGKRHGVPILEGDAKFHPLNLSHKETQLLETQQFKRSTIAGIFRVPAHMINDLAAATFSNIEHQDLGFVKHTLRPWMENWVQRCRMTLLEPKDRKNFFFAFDDHDLLRGDFPTRAEAISKLIQVGVYTPDDGRRAENLNPYGGPADKPFVNGTLRPIDEPFAPAAAGAPAKK